MQMLSSLFLNFYGHYSIESKVDWLESETIPGKQWENQSKQPQPKINKPLLQQTEKNEITNEKRVKKQADEWTNQTKKPVREGRTEIYSNEKMICM